LFQWDRGQKLKIKGLNLPNPFEMHIANGNRAKFAKRIFGNNNIIDIPDEYLLSGENIYLWLYLHETQDDS